MKIIYTGLFLLILFICGSKAVAQTDQIKLTATILHLDSAFWNAYNNCDTAHFKDFVTDDVEFYHDKGGITSGAAALIESLDKNICGKATYHLRREAVAATVKVYPMQKNNEIYGALISGEHLFYITENGKPEYMDGDANFTQLWLLKNGIWKMARILSYNHHAPEIKSTGKEIELTVQQLDQLTGTYKSEKFGLMSVIRENNVLILKGGNNSYRLYPRNDSLFFMKERDLTFQFVKDVTGNPIKIIVSEHGAKVDEIIYEK